MTAAPPPAGADDADRPVVADDGLERWLADLRAARPASARQTGVAGLRARPPRSLRAPEVRDVRDRVLAADGLDVPARVYRHAPSARPVVVYLHGGGWTFGDLDSHDRTCRRLAVAADAVVVSVDYRRAPEHPYPAAVEDAVAAVRAVRCTPGAVGGDGRVAVAGDSAGGTLAALVCLRLRAAGEPQPNLQALICPNTDLTLAQPSIRAKGCGWGLTADDLAWFVEQWVPDPAMRADPQVSPLHEPDLSGLAPALVVTAEHDPLRDEGDRYAAALAAAGVPVAHRAEPGLVHGFVGMAAISTASRDAGDQLLADIGRLVRADPPGELTAAGR